MKAALVIRLDCDGCGVWFRDVSAGADMHGSVAEDVAIAAGWVHVAVATRWERWYCPACAAKGAAAKAR